MVHTLAIAHSNCQPRYYSFFFRVKATTPPPRLAERRGAWVRRGTAGSAALPHARHAAARSAATLPATRLQPRLRRMASLPTNCRARRVTGSISVISGVAPPWPPRQAQPVASQSACRDNFTFSPRPSPTAIMPRGLAGWPGPPDRSGRWTKKCVRGLPVGLPVGLQRGMANRQIGNRIAAPPRAKWPHRPPHRGPAAPRPRLLYSDSRGRAARYGPARQSDMTPSPG